MVGGSRPRHKLMETERCSSSHTEREREWEISEPQRHTPCRTLTALPFKHVQNCDMVRIPPTCTNARTHTLISSADGSLDGSQHGANEDRIWQQKEKQPETHGRVHTTERISVTHSRSEVLNHKLKNHWLFSCGFCCGLQTASKCYHLLRMNTIQLISTTILRASGGGSNDQKKNKTLGEMGSDIWNRYCSGLQRSQKYMIIQSEPRLCMRNRTEMKAARTE